MKITFLDLRRKPQKLLEALKRREDITLSRRGKDIARIVPFDNNQGMKVQDHPAFGMWKDKPGKENVDEMIREMRKGRFDDI